MNELTTSPDQAPETPETSAHTPEFNEQLCVNCQVNFYEGNYPIRLCATCRQELINYPIPKWIKFFAIGLAAVIIISVIRTQLYFSAALNLGKGEKAIERLDFLDAQTELIKVVNKFPDHLEANADLFIAASYNMDFATAKIAFQRLEGKPVDDEELLNQVNTAMDFLNSSFAKDTVTSNQIAAAAKDQLQLLALYEKVKTANGEGALKAQIANLLFDLNDYINAEKVLTEALEIDPKFYYGLTLMSAVKRNLGKYDEALKICERMLDINHQDVYSISQQARIELKRKHDAQAKVYADKAMQLNPQNESALEARAMVDFFAGRKKESLASLSAINAKAALSGDSTVSKRLTAIINGSTNYR